MKPSVKDRSIREEYDFSNATRGRVVAGSGVKLPVTIRLDGQVIDFFKDQAESLEGKAKYQTLINQALKEYIAGVQIQRILLSDEFVSRLSQSLNRKIPSTKKRSGRVG